MSGNNPFGNQPGQPNQGPPYQGRPTRGPPLTRGRPASSPTGPADPARPAVRRWPRLLRAGLRPADPERALPGVRPGRSPGTRWPPGTQWWTCQGPGGPQQPYGAYNPGGQPPKKSKAVPIIIGAVVLALVVAAIGIGVAVSRGGDDPVAGGGTGGGGTSSAPPAEAKKASDAVKGYLDALAAGQAEAALAFGKDQPADKTFITDAVLADSVKRAPITDINVPEVADENAYQVSATYKIGGQAVNEELLCRARRVTSFSSPTPLPGSGSRHSARSNTVPMLLNGVKVDSRQGDAAGPRLVRGDQRNRQRQLGSKRSTFVLKSPGRILASPSS